MKNYLTLICSLVIIGAGTIQAEKDHIEGFILGGGIGGAFSTDRTTTEFLDYTGKNDWTPGLGLLPQIKIGFAPSDRFELILACRTVLFFGGSTARPLVYPFYGLGTTIHFVLIKWPVAVSALGGGCNLIGRTDDYKSNIGFGSFVGLGYEVFKHVSVNLDVGLLRPRLIYQIDRRDQAGDFNGYFNSYNTHNLIFSGLSLNYTFY